MDRVIVTSSNVKSVGYDRDTSTLEVEFHSTVGPRIYQYRPVEPDYYDQIVDPSRSAGKLVALLKGDPFVECQRVEAEVAADA